MQLASAISLMGRSGEKSLLLHLLPSQPRPCPFDWRRTIFHPYAVRALPQGLHHPPPCPRLDLCSARRSQTCSVCARPSPTGAACFLHPSKHLLALYRQEHRAYRTRYIGDRLYSTAIPNQKKGQDEYKMALALPSDVAKVGQEGMVKLFGKWEAEG